MSRMCCLQIIWIPFNLKPFKLNCQRYEVGIETVLHQEGFLGLLIQGNDIILVHNFEDLIQIIVAWLCFKVLMSWHFKYSFQPIIFFMKCLFFLYKSGDNIMTHTPRSFSLLSWQNFHLNRAGFQSLLGNHDHITFFKFLLKNLIYAEKEKSLQQ